MKNVVIGAAMNYGVEQIKNFVLSFRKYNQDDDIILIYNLNEKARIEDFAVKHNITLVDFGDYRNLSIHVVASRFIKYLDLVKDNPNYKNYLLADVRDVFFQGNPFELVSNGEHLFAFTEDPAVTIEKEKYHINMITRVFGEEELKRFAGKKIICSGTILGTREKMVNWLTIFCQYLQQIQKANPAICHEMLLDQVIANHIFYFQDNGKATEVKDNGDIVGTIGHCITHPDHSGDMKFVYNTVFLDGKKPSIIHQYDRSPELFNHISKLYPYVN